MTAVFFSGILTEEQCLALWPKLPHTTGRALTDVQEGLVPLTRSWGPLLSPGVPILSPESKLLRVQKLLTRSIHSFIPQTFTKSEFSA